MSKTMTALAGVLLFLGASSTGYAQDNQIGADAYTAACAVCHGSDGKGAGEFADVLTVAPPDLTVLKAQNDDVFPYLDVFQIVDGRTTLRAHGTGGSDQFRGHTRQKSTRGAGAPQNRHATALPRRMCCGPPSPRCRIGRAAREATPASISQG